MAVYRKNQVAYGMGSPRVDVFNAPIVSERAPTNRDRAEIGTIWCKKDVANTDNVYVLTSIVANVSNWTSCGGGPGVFDVVTVNPGDLTVTAGNAIITAGNLSLDAGSITVSAYVAAGVVINDAAGLLATSTGTNGQVLIGSTGVAPVWSTLTAGGGIAITEAAGTITIANPGATGTTAGTDVGGPVNPTVGGLTTFEGYDANIQTDGATANTVKLRLADDIVSVASITATNDLTMAAGTCTITSDDNAINAIHLITNAGVNETIQLRSAQGTSVDSLNLVTGNGGITFSAGRNDVNAINFVTPAAAGGVNFICGSGGVDIFANDGIFTVDTGLGAISIGADAFAKDVTLGNATGVSSLTLTSGTGDFVATSTDAMTLDSVGVLEINSSAGIIGIGNDAVAQNINIGTGAAARTISIGNTSGASAVAIDCGTGGVSVGASANAHTVTVGSVNTTSALTLQTGTGAVTGTFGGILDINATDAVTIDSTAGTLSIGSGADAFDINIGSGASERIVTIGNATDATSIVLNAGTAGVAVGSNAIAHPVVVGSVTGAANTTVQSGTGDFLITAGGILDVNATGAVTIDSTGGDISIGAGADAFDLNLATGAAEKIVVIGNATGASSATVNVGTGASGFAANATDHTTNVGSATGVSATTISAGTGGLTLAAAGIVDVPAATDTQAGAAVTVNANVGYGIFTGLTTAAAASQELAVTNAVCTVGSVILCTLSNFGVNDAQCTITRVVPAAGSFTVTYQNLGAAALNGNLVLSFWILVA